jgi:hypothetical protein
LKKTERNTGLGRSQTLPIRHNQPCLLRVAARDPTALTRFSACSSSWAGPTETAHDPEMGLCMCSSKIWGQQVLRVLSLRIGFGFVGVIHWRSVLAGLAGKISLVWPLPRPQKEDRKGVLRKPLRTKTCGPGNRRTFESGKPSFDDSSGMWGVLSLDRRRRLFHPSRCDGTRRGTSLHMDADAARAAVSEVLGPHSHFRKMFRLRPSAAISFV